MALISKSTQNDIVKASSTALAMGFSDSLTQFLSNQPGIGGLLNTKLNRELFQVLGGAFVLTSAKAMSARGVGKQAAVAIGTGMIASGAYSALSGITSNLLQTGLSSGSLLSGIGAYEGPAISAAQRAGLNGLSGSKSGVGASMLQPMV